MTERTQHASEATTSSMPGAPRRADIQGLRALAVTLVVAFHAGLPVPGGFTGVDVFFVISGFVITAMLMREREQTGGLAFRRFYGRRFLRLTPALALLVLVVAIASMLLQSPFGAQQTTARTGLGAMLLNANHVVAVSSGDYFAQAAVTNPLLHTWSLSVEEQFYLVFPALLMLGWVLLGRRLRTPGRGATIIVLLVIAGSLAVSIAWSFGGEWPAGLTSTFGGSTTLAYYASLSRAWEFAAGALLALLAPRLPGLSRSLASLLATVGLVLVIIGSLTIHESDAFPGLLALLPVIGTLLLLHAGSNASAGIPRLLSSRPLVALGNLSYSWYLWHWPLIVFTAILVPNEPAFLVVAAAVSLLPAAGSYRWVENPLRRWRPGSARAGWAIAVTTLAVPLAACLALLVGAQSQWGRPAVDADLQIAAPIAPRPSGPITATSGGDAVTDIGDDDVTGGDGGSLRSQHAAVRAGCVNTAFDPVGCRFGPAGARGTVLVAGDSQAYAVADGVIAGAQSLGLDTVVTSRTGCPLLARESSGDHKVPCRSWQRAVIDWALQARPEAVIIANLSTGYLRPEMGWRTAARDDGGRAGSQAEAATLWRRGLTPILRSLTSAGIPVVLVGAVPQMPGYTVRTSTLGGRPFERQRDEATKERQPAMAVERDIAAGIAGVTIIDPLPVLCDARSCPAERDGKPLYQDETHLSLRGSLLLTDLFAQELTRIGA